MKKARLDEELWEAQYSSISDFASDSNSDLEEKAEVEVLDEDPDGSCDLFDGVDMTLVRTLFTDHNSQFLANFEDYAQNVKSYMVQNDTVSCAPIVVLAFFSEYAGTSLLGEKANAACDVSMRSALVDDYSKMYGEMERQNDFIQGTGGKREGEGQPWLRVQIPRT
eukprot:CAMPEP_0174887312 /NCGR_PEP_ID=MMETSP0167-20121228/2552_1 /TAXON_ID=38298 /ORGANISM="Rhodella maculata, Strain CCMP736" /LENGTH=165 /DNA_ID=CAMNT_0016123731 /DNA_START=663 /DNA_END=1161 /DNA_ORIENTATION=-